MRPPMQAAALQQQHEHIHHHQQHQHQQHQQPHHQQHQEQQYQQHQQQSLSLTSTTTPTSLANQQQRKAKFSHKEILVENQLNYQHCSSVPTTAANVATQRTNHQAGPFALTVQSNKNIHTYQQQKHSKHPHYKYQPYEDSIQLVDLSSSPAHNTSSAAYHELPRCTPRTRSNSLISDCPYSRSSSSEDGSYAGERLYYQTRTQIFEDPAEHFIINFPAADSPTHNRHDDIAINLPLSETEPLLTNIETTNAGPQRSLCLSKNSGSLIFTRKDLTHQQQVHQRNSNNSANGNNNLINTHHKRSSVGNIGATALQPTPATAHRRQHRSFRSAERSRKHRQQQTSYSQQQQQQQQHNQQHRHSLQLNYNNNLIGTNSGGGGSACGNSNNNYYCSPSSAVASKSNFNRGNSSSATTTTTTTATTGITAAVTRKQHAYSWYAPVYSALEEELEQDSRDSSPVHNLANTKKHHLHHYQHRSVQNSSQADNETDALLEARNQINIQPQLHSSQATQANTGKTNAQVAVRRSSLAVQAPSSLPLQNTTNGFAGNGGAGDLANGLAVTTGSYDGSEGPQAGSLGLAGGPLPRLKRWENFIKNFFIRPSHNGRGGVEAILPTTATNAADDSSPANQLHLPASPEIRIIRTPSEQNMVIMRDPSGRCTRQDESEKLTNGLMQGSTSSLNVVQQKLWNIMRRDGSAASLYQEKSNSIVQYRGMRKCETVLALTRQSGSVCSPVLGVGPGIIGGAATNHMGSGIFSATGIEQIRPLNRLRNSVSTMNATCSRCSSLLSLAASGSRYSLNIAANGATSGFVNTMPTAMSISQQQQQQQQKQQQKQQQNPSNLSSSNLSCNKRSRSRSDNIDSTMGPSFTATRHSNSGQGSRKSSAASSSISPPSNVTTATFTPSTSTPNTPTKTSNGCRTSVCNDGVILSGFPPPASIKTAIAKQPITVTSLLSMSSCSATSSSLEDDDEEENEEHMQNVDVTGVKIAVTSSSSPSSSTSSLSSATSLKTKRKQHKTQQQQQQQLQHLQLQAHATQVLQVPIQTAASFTPTISFEIFTCKMCLVDVESADEATTLVQCGCRFCTECMKAYVEFEISEGAYEISCPDPQCPAQSIVTLPEIANLTTTNLMKKHHRYRLNREIELDKSRTWCPRAGCETVCLVGSGGHADAAPSTSTSHNAALNPTTIKENEAITQLLCSVQCPSCKDEFCSACKKTWHPNITCEENSRRLVADGQDDIGIPFDNDLIKCCPMCAVPIEKDEGCAQMMCKRCKHVFCWYCLASLDDDFLLRHYDKGPCKNKLGHSRASVVWHRAQVIGIFAGFGILLLVASPLLLLAAPCIICCKCRICSGSKVDEGDGGELEEATALQS